MVSNFHNVEFISLLWIISAGVDDVQKNGRLSEDGPAGRADLGDESDFSPGFQNDRRSVLGDPAGSDGIRARQEDPFDRFPGIHLSHGFEVETDLRCVRVTPGAVDPGRDALLGTVGQEDPAGKGR